MVGVTLENIEACVSLLIENIERYSDNQLVLQGCLVNATHANRRVFVKIPNYSENIKKLRNDEMLAQCKPIASVNSSNSNQNWPNVKYS